MLTDTMVDELQVYGPVLLTRRGGQWWAAWQIEVRFPQEQWIYGASGCATTVAGAIRALWERIEQADSFEIVHETVQKLRWNGVWQETRREAPPQRAYDDIPF